MIISNLINLNLNIISVKVLNLQQFIRDMQIQEPKPEFFQIIKRRIPIKIKTKQMAQDIICLKDDKCGILFETFVLVVDLNQERSLKNEIIALNLKDKIYEIVPVGAGFYYNNHFSSCESIDQKRRKSSVKMWMRCFQNNQVVNFYYAQRALLKTKGLSNSPQYTEIAVRRRETKDYVEGPKHVISKADDNGQIYVEEKANTRTLLNLFTFQEIQIELPSIEKNQTIQELFLIDKKLAIYASSSKVTSLFSHKKAKDTIKIGLVTLKADGKFSPLFTFSNRNVVKFWIMNPELNILVFELSQCNYLNNELSQLSPKMILFDYEKRKIVGSLDYIEQNRMTPKLISPDFKHFLEPIKRDSRLEYVVEFRFVQAKKAIMHLFRKSRIFQMFGEEMIRQLFKVML